MNISTERTFAIGAIIILLLLLIFRRSNSTIGSVPILPQQNLPVLPSIITSFSSPELSYQTSGLANYVEPVTRPAPQDLIFGDLAAPAPAPEYSIGPIPRAGLLIPSIPQIAPTRPAVAKAITGPCECEDTPPAPSKLHKPRLPVLFRVK